MISYIVSAFLLGVAVALLGEFLYRRFRQWRAERDFNRTVLPLWGELLGESRKDETDKQFRRRLSDKMRNLDRGTPAVFGEDL